MSKFGILQDKLPQLNFLTKVFTLLVIYQTGGEQTNKGSFPNLASNIKQMFAN